MGESGSLVQAAGSAAFLSPEMGEQQSRNVPERERERKKRKDLSAGKETGKREQEKKRGKVGHFTMGGLKLWNRLIYQVIKLSERRKNTQSSAT